MEWQNKSSTRPRGRKKILCVEVRPGRGLVGKTKVTVMLLVQLVQALSRSCCLCFAVVAGGFAEHKEMSEGSRCVCEVDVFVCRRVQSKQIQT